MVANFLQRCGAYLLVSVAASLLSATAAGQEVTLVLNASKDNTLFEDTEGDVSNGQGPFLYAGLTGPNDGINLRRGLIAFDLSLIPAGATITDVTLSMYLSKSSPTATAANISLHAATSNWGEGASNAGSPGGGGAPAQTGDATWLFNFYNTSPWAQPGGDFSPTASATTSVAIVNRTYNWSSSALIADVQGWLDKPATNFGWFIIGDEARDTSAQRFNSSESTSNVPALTVAYTIPEPSTVALCTVATLGFGWRRRTARAR